MARQTLRDAKVIALDQLDHDWVRDAFAKHLEDRYRVPRDRIVFDVDAAVQRVRDAVLLPAVESKARCHEISGETDGETIWITRDLDLDDCVETLLHEAMHDSVFVLRDTRSGMRKGLSELIEHDVIYQLLPW